MTQVADRVALPVRVHDLLLGLAGRLDDDALTDARELLASAELDRALELTVGCLAAGRIPLSPAERGELRQLFAEAHLDGSLVERLSVTEGRTAPRHRFTAGPADGRGAEQGVARAIHRVLEVLPDVRAVWCVWRTTPAGVVAGPVPNRVVLAEIGSRGFPPATAYRIEHALRRVGIRAAVEVLRDTAPLSEYHRNAMEHARRVSFDQAEPMPWEDDSSPSPPAPATVTNPAPTLPAPAPEPAVSTPPPPPAPAPAALPEPEPEISIDPPRASIAERPASAEDPDAVKAKETTSVIDAVPAVDEPAPERPAPRSSSRPARPDFERAGSRRKKSPVDRDFEDTELSDQERDLLRQLQDELAKRERAEADEKYSWQTDRSGRHHDASTNSRANNRIVNGVPPNSGEPPRYPPSA